MNRTDIAVEELEPGSISESTLREFHALRVAQLAEARPHDEPTPIAVLTAGLGALPEFMEITLLLARDKTSQAVGYAYLNYARTEAKSHTAELLMWADPSHRRLGAASALLDAVRGVAQKRGYDVLRTTTTEGIGWGADLCRSVGGHPVLDRRTWRLPLADVDRDEIRLIGAQAAERARGYSLEEVSGGLPEELVHDAVALLQFLRSEERGESDDQAAAEITVPMLREMETTWEAMGLQRRWLFARHESSGSLAGVVDGLWQPQAPATITQDNTVVRPEYRGRSLALWMKACMIDKLLDEWSKALDIRTTTTFPNAAMDSVDERLGFVPYVRYTVWEIGLDALGSWLESGRL